MKKIGTTFIFLLFLSLIANVAVYAEKTYSVIFQFIEVNGENIEKEVMDLLPENITGLSDFQEVEIEDMNDIETKEYKYHFIGWNTNRIQIKNDDVIVTGTWKKENKYDNKADSQKIKVHYEFVEANAVNGLGYLPDEVNELLYDDIMININQEIPLPEISSKEISGYRFLGYNTPSLELTTGNITVQGVWIKNAVTYEVQNVAPVAETVSGLGNAWSYQRNDGTNGYSRYQYTINGSPAWCIEPDVTVWPLANTDYKYIGYATGKVATIIGMGVKNGMSAGAIQAAVDVFEGFDASSNDGMNYDPFSNYYLGDGSYACKIEVYEPVGYGGEIQRLGTNPVCEPVNPTLSIKKVSSGDFDYANNCPGVYSLANAEYGVFKDLECTNKIATLKTKKNGNTAALELKEGTYYIKELVASEGYKLDETVYTAVLQKGKSKIITSVEEPYDDPTSIHLIKKSSNESGYVEYLDTAEFTLKYYDTYGSIASKNAKYEWIFKPIIKNKQAMVFFDREHFVSGNEELFDNNGSLKIPLGIFTIEETKAPQTYSRDNNVYQGRVFVDNGMVKVEVNGGVDLEVENEQMIQMEKVIILHTKAIFEESGDNRYYADGVAHIKDIVEYENLDEDKEYVLKGKLVEKTLANNVWSKTSELMESQTVFVSSGKGKVEVEFEIDLDLYPDKDFVVFEYLYEKDNPDMLVNYHEDLSDKDQSLRVEPLYEADFTLYKVSGMSKNIKLSGAYYDISSSRTKRDGTTVEKKIGRYVTGGIFYQNDTPFEIQVYKDETLNDFVGTYESEFDKRFSTECISILNLEEGTYFVKGLNNEEPDKWIIEKGTIHLPKQPEDTIVKLKEVVAPKGYFLDNKEYTVDIGHDTSKTRIENYRINAAIIPYEIPKTGID